MKTTTACFVLIITLMGLCPAWGTPGPVPVPRGGGRLPGAAAVAPAFPVQGLRPCLPPAPGVSALGEVPRPPTAHRPAAVPAPAARRMPRPVGLGLALRTLRRAALPGGGVAGRSGSDIKPIGWVALGLGVGSGLTLLFGILLLNAGLAGPLIFLLWVLWPLLGTAAVVFGITGIVRHNGPTQALCIIGLVLGTAGLLYAVAIIVGLLMLLW